MAYIMWKCEWMPSKTEINNSWTTQCERHAQKKWRCENCIDLNGASRIATTKRMDVSLSIIMYHCHTFHSLKKKKKEALTQFACFLLLFLPPDAQTNILLTRHWFSDTSNSSDNALVLPKKRNWRSQCRCYRIHWREESVVEASYFGNVC